MAKQGAKGHNSVFFCLNHVTQYSITGRKKSYFIETRYILFVQK